MATDNEILELWNSFSKGEENSSFAAIRFYRLAEKEGKQAGVLALEKELLSDETILAAMHVFGWERQKKSSLITLRAIQRETIKLAMAKVKK